MPKRRPRESQELEVAVELVVIDGEEGRRLHENQSPVVFEVLAWLASNRPPSDIDLVDEPTRRSDDR